MPTAITPSKYAIELRDRGFNLKGRIEDYVTGSIRWDWNRIGGCGRATFKIDGDYVRYMIAADDDVRIYLPDEGGGASRWYRGYVESAAPSIQGGGQSIQVECQGYFGILDRIVVNDDGEEQIYLNQEISQVVESVIDDFISVNSDITKGTIEAGSFQADRLEFKESAGSVIKTLVDIAGDIECGVDENLEFFWVNQGTQILDRFFVGDKITKLSDRVDYRNIQNKIFFEGGQTGGSTYKTTGASVSSQARYGKREVIVSNSAITTESTANQYITGLLRKNARPVRQLAVSLMNFNRRIERNRPMGEIAVRDPGVSQLPGIYGTTGAGGSGLIYGSIANGGSGRVYGGTPKYQVDRVTYTFSPEDGRVNAEIQFGDSLAISRASATLKRIDTELNAVRRRSL